MLKLGIEVSQARLGRCHQSGMIKPAGNALTPPPLIP